MAKRAFLVGSNIGATELKVLLKEFRVSSQDFLVGVDGGTRTWIEAGWRPSFAVGDWDSLKGGRKILQSLPHISLSRHKNRSDLFYAAWASLALGAKELISLGVTGGRSDHHLAALYDLSEISSGRYGAVSRVQAFGFEAQYYFLSPHLSFWKGELKKGALVSVFSLDGKAFGVSLKGFRYSLRDSVLGVSSLGLSNVVVARKCEVRLRKGRLLVIMPRNESKSGSRK